MRIHQPAGRAAHSLEPSTTETPVPSQAAAADQGWPLGLKGLLGRRFQRRSSADAAPRRHHGGDANAEIQEVEALYDAFVVAKYLADPLHGTADKTAELLNEIPKRGEPEHAPEAEQSTHPPEHPPADHAPLPEAGHHWQGSAPTGAPEHSSSDQLPTLDGQHTTSTAGAVHAEDPHAVGHAAKESVLHTLAEEGAPGGTFELAMTLGISGVMLPLSSLAIYAAYKETREVAEQRSTLRRRERQLQAEREALAPAMETSPYAVVASAHMHALDEAIETVTYQQQRNARDGAIAVTSMGSASVIFTKAASEIAIEGGLAIGANSTNAAGLISHSAAAAGAASVAGIAGTFVLAPLASVAATALGATFLRQSRKEKTRVVVDMARVTDFLQRLEPGDLSPGAQRYQHFLSVKLAQRSGFAGSFNDWNKAFVVGGATYTASTLTKAGVGVAVLLGAAAVTGPVGTGLIVGAGLLGAATMGIGGHQFLLAHGKQKRYRRYQDEDMSGVDRTLLAVADLLHTPDAPAPAYPDLKRRNPQGLVRDGQQVASQRVATDRGAAEGIAVDTIAERAGSSTVHDHGEPTIVDGAAADRMDIADDASTVAGASVANARAAAVAQHGFELRSALFACVDGHEKALETLLQTCADGTNKRYRSTPRSNEERAAAREAAPGASLSKRVNATLFAAATYGRAMLTGKARQAGKKAARSYAKHSDTLTETALEQWLQAPASLKPQIDYMQCCLEMQQTYLAAKLKMRPHLPVQTIRSAAASAAEPMHAAAAEHASASLIAQLQETRERDEMQLRTINLMLEELSMAAEEAASSDARKNRFAMSRMPRLQQRLVGVLTSNAVTARPGSACFAHFCMKQARKHATDMRGTLLQTEVQAAHIRERATSATVTAVARSSD
ncbi:type III secretion system effector XopK [Xanthomonas vesicatoria]|uniref:Type III secretion system effector protein XopK n=1 Tax=Xanthomonas vesicatoria TaxID=56460 RepID=A0ABS8L983_9XANT|nr:type III secretion system effector XopK [Xanthomonas vesicatoria]MCC8560333.1 type III secretion system effector protein XopK [Xanthomonas vesicatoria]MCC8601294.1 type III secretion system effector protein XopK [Xanthomonas vesicatoria]MCC8610645.1 type III secretion system effector protein XopK [Xanthomonas vesicatoria]MCC8621742.1 type III secretion system effector protein XopK [Xanthomonas vesicatoria]MCC8673108.1 type III secretion system effector protein XopK [Xanthomonas vesicatoria]